MKKKLKLNSLKGCTVLSPELLDDLGIHEGVLAGEIRNYGPTSKVARRLLQEFEGFIKGSFLLKYTKTKLNQLQSC
jgi:hypothetical protein